MQKKFILITIIGLGLSVGCMKVKNKDTNPETPSPVTQQKDLHQQKVSVEYVAGQTANSYVYKFSFSDEIVSLAKSTAIFVKKTNNSVAEINEVKLLTDNTWVDDKINQTDSTTYEFGYFDNKNFISFGSLSAESPKDLVISGVTKWSSIKDKFELDNYGRYFLKKFHRLYLDEKSILLTEGENLNINLKNLYSNNAEIQNWPEGQKATPGKSGRNGGQIVINAESASGRIQISLRGESGADGQAGPTDDRLNGAPGLPGEDHEIHETPPPSSCGFCVGQVSCIKNPTNGGPGGAGTKGHKGSYGLKGGNSGFVLFKVTKPSDFVWNITVTPGLGGVGGAGGRGGLGGAGGKAGESTYQTNLTPTGRAQGPCKPALNGQQGRNGDDGDPGESGSNGTKEVSCFTEADKAPICL